MEPLSNLGKPKLGDSHIAHFRARPRALIPRTRESTNEVTVSLTEEQCMAASSHVKGFAFEKKQWCKWGVVCLSLQNLTL